MTFRDWIQDTEQRISNHGLNGARVSVQELFFGAVRRFDRLIPFGTPVYEHDWDVLVILDACRADLMTEVINDYEFVNEETITSVAGGSRTWMKRTFDEQYADKITDTVYVTGNPFSDEMIDPNRFENVEEVWRYGWDEQLNTVPARAMTDVAIHEHRRSKPKRMIVHYMQPHHPFVPNPMDAGMNRDDLSSPEGDIWSQIKNGEVDPEDVWREYRNNLRYVLDDVSILLENIDAEKVAVSADHGNAIGEWGFYGHGDVPFSAVREVPWCLTSATDRQTYEPDIEVQKHSHNVDEKLEHLGYL